MLTVPRYLQSNQDFHRGEYVYGSQYSTVLPQDNMVDLTILETVKTFLEDQTVQEKIEETARIFFSNGGITVNLIPALAILGLGLLALAPLLGIPLLPLLSGITGGGSTTGSGSYGTPATGYGEAYSRASSDYYEKTVADLQTQVAALQDSELDLRNQLYYNTASSASSVASNQIGYTT